MRKVLQIFLIIFLLMIGYLLYDYRVGLQNFVQEKFGFSIGEMHTDTDLVDDAQRYSSDSEQYYIRFAGQSRDYVGLEKDTIHQSFLIKGKLLDEKYRRLYDQIPDTISLGFGQNLSWLAMAESQPSDADARFAYSLKDDVDSLKIDFNADASTKRSMIDKLIYDGKVEGYRIFPDKFASPKFLYSYEAFENKYGNHFPANAHFFYLEMDYDLKEALLTFFDTEEGQNFTYPDDRRTYQELLHYGNFTGAKQPELAVVLRNQQADADGDDKEALIVIAYDHKKQRYYCVYKALYYQKIAISTRSGKAGDTATDLTRLRVKLLNNREFILQYNSEFDTMEEMND